MNRQYSNLRALALFVLMALFAFPMAWGQSQEAKDLNRKGKAAQQSGNFNDANESLQKAIKLDPNWAEPYYNYYMLLRVAKKGADSRKFIKKAFDLEPNNQTYQEEYSRLLKDDLAVALQAKDKDKAAAIRALILQTNPNELEIGSEMVGKAFDAKDYAKARALIKDLLEKNKEELPKYTSPALGDLFYYLARIEAEAKEMKPAMEHSSKATHYPGEKADEAKELYNSLKKEFQATVEGYISQGKAFYDKGNQPKALEELNKALAMDPGNETAQNYLDLANNKIQEKDLIADANKLVAEGKWLEARDCLEIILQYSPGNTDAKKKLEKAIAFEEVLMKKLGKAERLPRSLEERVSMTESFLAIGKRYMEGKNHKEAQIAFDRATALIGLDSRLDKFKAIMKVETDKIASVDTSVKTWEKAREQYKNQEFEECLKSLQQLRDDYQPDIFSFYAYCYWKTGNKEKGKEYAHRQLDRQPDNNRAKFVLASLFFESGDNTSAFKLAQEIREADPDYPGIDDLYTKTGAMSKSPMVIPILIICVLLYIAYTIYNNLPEYYKNAGIKKGKAFLAKGMHKEAIEELNKVKKMSNLTPFDGMLISRILAQAFLKNAQYDKAIGECKHLLAGNPSDADAHQWLGFAYLGRRSASPETLPELLNLYKTEKKNVALLQLLGHHYTSAKVLSPDGVEVLERWYEHEPTNPDVLKSLGRYYLQKGKTDPTALKVFESMMTTSKPEPEFMLGVAKIQLRLGQHENCLKICETVLTMDVNNELVHPLLRECYKKMNKLPDLVEIYRTFLQENPYNVAFQKGLVEATKMLGKVEQAPEGAPGANLPPQTQAGENQVVCPNCNKPSLVTDYYCQHCGQSMRVE